MQPGECGVIGGSVRQENKCLWDPRPTVTAGFEENRGRAVAVQTLVVDFLVTSPDGVEPSTKVLTYMLSPTGERREHERLNINEAIVAMGRGDVATQRSDIPRYGELIQYACGRLGWNLSHFNAYRCRVEYPGLGSSLDLHFDYPDSEEAG